MMSMPGQSNGLRVAGRRSGSSRQAAAITAAAMGRLTRKSQCQLKRSSTPPMIGPMRKARPKTAPISPSALPRFSGGKVSPMTALATGKMPPAPKPCTARPNSTTSKVGAAATMSEPTAKVATLST